MCVCVCVCVCVSVSVGVCVSLSVSFSCVLVPAHMFHLCCMSIHDFADRDNVRPETFFLAFHQFLDFFSPFGLSPSFFLFLVNLETPTCSPLLEGRADHCPCFVY